MEEDYKKRVLAGLAMVKSFRNKIDEGFIIDNATIKIGEDIFRFEKRNGRKYEYSVYMNDEYIKCAEDNTLCRNNGRCMSCGYCM